MFAANCRFEANNQLERRTANFKPRTSNLALKLLPPQPECRGASNRAETKQPNERQERRRRRFAWRRRVHGSLRRTPGYRGARRLILGHGHTAIGAGLVDTRELGLTHGVGGVRVCRNRQNGRVARTSKTHGLILRIDELMTGRPAREPPRPNGGRLI